MPEISYTSRLALALRAMQNRAAMDTFDLLTNIATNMQRPEVLDNFDLDHSVRRWAINQGTSPRDIRPFKDVIKLREARAKQQQQQQALAAAEQASKAAKNLGSAPQALQDKVAEQIPA
jgi:hypothetical protein